jgi:hypothetical protein
MAADTAHSGFLGFARLGCAPCAPCSSRAAALLGACAALPERADPLSDAPEARSQSAAGFVAPPSYSAALQTWRRAEDVNAWIGARFEYDRARALQLSETQRNQGSRLPIHPAAAFYERRKASASTSRASRSRRCARSTRRPSPPT